MLYLITYQCLYYTNTPCEIKPNSSLISPIYASELEMNLSRPSDLPFLIDDEYSRMTGLAESQFDICLALYPFIETVQRLQRAIKVHRNVFAKRQTMLNNNILLSKSERVSYLHPSRMALTP